MRRRQFLAATGTAATAGLAGCAGLPFGEAPEINEAELAPVEFSSPAVEDGTLPAEYTCDGEEISPPLAIGSPPERAGSFAVVVDRLDGPAAPSAYWTIWDIPIDTREIPAGIPKEPRIRQPIRATQGLNLAAAEGYLRPCPEPGTTAEFEFSCYAVLNETLGAPERAKRKEVMTRIADTVVGIGSFTVSYRR